MVIPFICSPEPKAQGELFLSKGAATVSVVRHDASTIFFTETTKQIYIKFDLNHPCDSHTGICSCHFNWPLLGAAKAKNKI
jgi:hypothetical protein